MRKSEEITSGTQDSPMSLSIIHDKVYFWINRIRVCLFKFTQDKQWDNSRCNSANLELEDYELNISLVLIIYE